MNGQFFLFPIILLLGICGPANQAVENQTATQPPAVAPQAPSPPPNVTQADLQTWDYINKASVEAACLSEAKAKAGSYAWAVQGCACDETVGDWVKDYDCGISTVQGTLSAHISCVLADRTCSLASAYGNGNMTFDQIRQLQVQPQAPVGG